MEKFRFGDIVMVAVADPNGRNVKSRPVLIVSPDEEIDRSEELLAVAISSSYIADPLPDQDFDIPWETSGHRITGLNRRSVAKCDWRLVISIDSVERKCGRAPDKVMYQIASYFKNCSS